jgi:superfamily II DNA/RNA helicase
LPAVVNYDLLRSTVDYIHRIGRTGAGESGVAGEFRHFQRRGSFPGDDLAEQTNTVTLLDQAGSNLREPTPDEFTASNIGQVG